MLARAQKLLARGHAADAERLLSAEMPRHSKNPRYAIILSHIREAQDDLPGAIEAITESLRHFPEHAPSHLQHGILLSDSAARQDQNSAVEATAPDPNQEARAAFERVLELQPKNDVARSYLALTLFKLNDATAGAALFRRYGFNDNRMFRVRVTEWVEEQWLRENRYFADISPAEPPSIAPNLFVVPPSDLIPPPFVVPPLGGGVIQSSSPLRDTPTQNSELRTQNSPPLLVPPSRGGVTQSSSRSDTTTQNSELRTQNSTKDSWRARRARERRAGRAYARRDYAAAIEQLEPSALSDQPDPGASSYCASACEMLNQHARGLRIIDHLLKNIPEDDWPDQLTAARGRLLVRLRRFGEAAALLNRVTVVGPEDNGTNYYFGVLALAANQRPLARQLFFRAHTQYLIDTLEAQWWQTEQALLH